MDMLHASILHLFPWAVFGPVGLAIETFLLLVLIPVSVYMANPLIFVIGYMAINTGAYLAIITILMRRGESI